MSKKPFYITTPIYYPSGNPHIGHCYTTVACDSIARYRRMQGYDVIFLTGTDEHGLKIEQKAAAKGITPKEYVDEIVKTFKALWEKMHVSYDRYIRTTDDYHIETVQKIFKRLYDLGYIYKGEYKGKYCTPCESFWTESQLDENGCCPECHREVVEAKEEAYFMKMAPFAERIEKLLLETDYLQPKTRAVELVNNFIKPGLEDLCVSRTSFTWGIPVTFDPKHVVYVWVDALSNYISALGYENNAYHDFDKYWPADVHMVAKDIMREMALGADSSFSNEIMINRINSDLANGLGNLVSRTVAMVDKYFGGTLPTERQSGEFDEELIAAATGLTAKLEGLLDQTQLNHMLAEIFQVVSRANKYIDETAPWILAREEANRTRLATVLYNLLETIRIITVPLSAFMPETMPKIWEQIGASEADVAYSTAAVFGTLPANVTVHKGDIIFPRIDVEKEIDELNQLILAAQPKEEPQEPEFTPQPLAEEIDIDTFGKTDLRVAKVLECEKVKKSKKLLKLQLDDGMGGRQVVSGIAPWYKPEDLIGKKIVLVANLKPAKLCGVESCGMICAADMPNGDVKVIFPDESLPVGSKIR